MKKQQEACLELVAEGMSSKEIAQRLGLSPRSVDAYLTAAIATLQATNRREAARIFISQKRLQKLPSQSPPLAEPVIIENVDHGTGLKWLAHAIFPIPMGGRINSLGASEKLFYSARIGLSGIVLLLAITTTFMGLLAVL
ncbi:helix-turn-helix transcriptional regulator [Sphingomonas sp. S2M10]|uniref:helix-turn-helix domain-containing protein n=1 Tax=Sphingomonas sp. S2M10 TaxID=2705010 RepID=UPI0014563F2E|nr:helix-turn-helix transcriptional regulator [Sphingomonas sp. S2M10]